MRSHDRLWLNEHQRRAPIPPDSGQHDPEQPVARPDTHTRGRAFHRPELLPQRNVLQDQFVMASGGQRQSTANQHHQRQHASIVSGIAGENQSAQRRTEFWRTNVAGTRKT
jgi:hypothetical protein